MNADYSGITSFIRFYFVQDINEKGKVSQEYTPKEYFRMKKCVCSSFVVFPAGVVICTNILLFGFLAACVRCNNLTYHAFCVVWGSHTEVFSFIATDDGINKDLFRWYAMRDFIWNRYRHSMHRVPLTLTHKPSNFFGLHKEFLIFKYTNWRQKFNTNCLI